jgi:hypothetical protein
MMHLGEILEERVTRFIVGRLSCWRRGGSKTDARQNFKAARSLGRFFLPSSIPLGTTGKPANPFPKTAPQNAVWTTPYPARPLTHALIGARPVKIYATSPMAVSRGAG